nr:hypothetical protein [Borreliella burgdorferi]
MDKIKALGLENIKKYIFF